jgi:hypothetical protein
MHAQRSDGSNRVERSICAWNKYISGLLESHVTTYSSTKLSSSVIGEAIKRCALD